MAKANSRQATSRKIFFRPYGFRALLTVDAIALSGISGLLVFMLAGIYNFSDQTKAILAGLTAFAIIVFFVMKEPKEYVALFQDGLHFKKTRFFITKDCMAKFSDIKEVYTRTLSKGAARSTYLEIVMRDNTTHSFAKELFNKNQDYEEFKQLVLKNSDCL
ncbi:MAG: hypothetical protein KKB51_19520 [Candidatus Riflebacteria bacterium]|nr:hypothetical protein [Candidatus Riflebacteria bacterium]